MKLTKAALLTIAAVWTFEEFEDLDVIAAALETFVRDRSSWSDLPVSDLDRAASLLLELRPVG